MIRIAASEYPASPAWKNGASNPGDTASTRGSGPRPPAAIAASIGSMDSTPGAIAGPGGVALLPWHDIAAIIGL
jgi:hypothetical protein